MDATTTRMPAARATVEYASATRVRVARAATSVHIAIANMSLDQALAVLDSIRDGREAGR